jgi:predicted membrane protein
MRNNLFLGFVLITFGILFLLNNLDIADFGDLIHDYWPLIIIFWGLSMLMRKKKPEDASSVAPSSPVENTQSESLNESMVFGNIYTTVTSQSFKGGSVSTVFGDCTLDLSKTFPAEGEHILRVHGVFGNSTIFLPKDSAVAVSANSLFGRMQILGQRKDGLISELKTATTNYETAEKRLKIVVTKVFGNTAIG